ncbi:hypothetical protein [Coralliovum pocilloporae]|uniref:hypothetical protein n=1 Tax=Coralliovum pocilloporae TaxID=3066369 RepID=UPI003306C3AC
MEKRGDATRMIYRGQLAGQTYRWSVTYFPKGNRVEVGRKGEQQFKRFIASSRKAFPNEIRTIVGDKGRGPVNGDTGDRIFCGVLGILLAENPPAAAGVYALCEWFASNGLD